MTGAQLDLFAPQIGLPIIMAIDPDGPVIQGAIDETLTLPHPRMVWDRARIELHRHTDGNWMWATAYHHDTGGGGYRVGPKWGNFASSRADALHFAKEEIISHLDRPEDRGAGQIIEWMERLT